MFVEPQAPSTVLLHLQQTDQHVQSSQLDEGDLPLRLVPHGIVEALQGH